MSDALASMVPLPGERVVFAGQTGSGKTTLARALCRFRRYVVVLDTKGRVDWPGYVVERRLTGAMRQRAERITYRPDYDELASPERLNTFFHWVYKRERTTLYVDELSDATEGDSYPYWLGACLRKGRELLVETWCATQRPTRIPQIVLSESEHFFCFRLKMPQDRDRVEAIAGIDSARIARLAKRDFLYSGIEDSVKGPYRLDL